MPEKQYFTGIDVVDAVRIDPLTVTQDGTYTAPTGVLGYNPVVVKCNEPWEPLEDGYSNFWFELTNDTLSPWLNFSTKENNATIDWGDGSGEQALDTLTPTHTYSKAGRYVVKVKGVTGLSTLQNLTKSNYFNCLKYAELNTEISSIDGYSFAYCLGLKKITHNVNEIGTYTFYKCVDLEEIQLENVAILGSHAFNGATKLHDVHLYSNLQSIPQSLFNDCKMIEEITIPQTVTSIGNTAFSQDTSLYKVHVLATTPPTLGTNAFQSLPAAFTIYVPAGTLSAYQTAWSNYSEHIVEEGSQLSVSQLRKIAEETNNGEMR